MYFVYTVPIESDVHFKKCKNRTFAQRNINSNNWIQTAPKDFVIVASCIESRSDFDAP